MVDREAMKAYSEDLRQKVVEAVEQHGTSKSEAARLFGISLSSVKRYARLASEGEPLAPRKGGGSPQSGRSHEEAARRKHTNQARRYRQREAQLPGKDRRQEPERAHLEEDPKADGLL
jgi:transposase